MSTGGEPWPLAVRETGVQPGEAPLKAGSNPDSLNGKAPPLGCMKLIIFWLTFVSQGENVDINLIQDM